MGDEGVYVLFQDDSQQTTFATFEDMLRKNELTDVIIGIRNQSFPAHRVVLAARIPYLRKIFTKKAEETPILDIDPETLESIIEYAYKGKLKITSANVKYLLSASKILELNQIRNACSEFLEKRPRSRGKLEIQTLDNTIYRLRVAEKPDDDVKENFDELSKSEKFLNFSYYKVKDIISSDDLAVANEEAVFEAIIRWVKVAPSARLDVLPELFKCVRLACLPLEYLIRRVSSEELIRTSSPCKDLIEEVKNYHLLPDKAFQIQTSLLQPRKKHSKKLKIGIVGRNRIDMYALSCCWEAGTTVYRYDCAEEKWAKVGTRRLCKSADHAVGFKDRIYIFEEGNVLIFDTRTVEWTEIKSWNDSLSCAGIIFHNEKIYCFGGTRDLSCKIRCFDLTQNKWTKGGWMRRSRVNPGVASLGEYIYLIGGRDYDSPRRLRTQWYYYDTVERYDSVKEKWNDVPKMHRSRCGHGCCGLNGQIYVCGGTNGLLLDSGEVYDLRTNKWSFISRMNTPRDFFSLVSYKGELYAIGGRAQDGVPIFKVEKYNPTTKQWRDVTPIFDHRDAVCRVVAVTVSVD